MLVFFKHVHCFNFVAPPKLDYDRRYDNMSVHVGGLIKLLINTDGDPQPTVQWYKDGAPLKQRKNVTIDTDEFATCLTIKHVSRGDRGAYKLVARNEWGTTEVIFDINVNCK